MHAVLSYCVEHSFFLKQLLEQQTFHVCSKSPSSLLSFLTVFCAFFNPALGVRLCSHTAYSQTCTRNALVSFLFSLMACSLALEKWLPYVHE